MLVFFSLSFEFLLYIFLMKLINCSNRSSLSGASITTIDCIPGFRFTLDTNELFFVLFLISLDLESPYLHSFEITSYAHSVCALNEKSTNKYRFISINVYFNNFQQTNLNCLLKLKNVAWIKCLYKVIEGFGNLPSLREHSQAYEITIQK